MTFLIAEIGNNHDGDFERAKSLIRLAALSGVDAVKFQIFKAERLVHHSMPSRVKGHATQLERMKTLEFSKGQWDELYYLAKEYNVEFMATCFDLETLDEWAPRLNRIKIASGDITYTQMIRQAGSYGKPVYISTGGATAQEIDQAAQWVDKSLLTFLHCVSRYPCINPNLGLINVIKEKYRVGYSCHTPGIEACYIAACMGVEVIEKHFTDKNMMYGDHVHSALPSEMKKLSERMKERERLCGTEKESPDLSLRRGNYAARRLVAGGTLSDGDYLNLRPSLGDDTNITGRKLRKDYDYMDSI